MVVVQSPSHAQLLATPWTVARQASLSITISWSLPKFMSIKSMMPSKHLILCRSLLLLPSIFPSIRQGLFQWVSSLHQVGQRTGASASVLPMNIQGWFPLGLTGLISLLSQGLSRVFSNSTIQKHQFFGAQPSLWSNSHICTQLLKRSSRLLYSLDYTRPLLAKWCLCFLTHDLGWSWFSQEAIVF